MEKSSICDWEINMHWGYHILTFSRDALHAHIEVRVLHGKQK